MIKICTQITCREIRRVKVVIFDCIVNGTELVYYFITVWLLIIHVFLEDHLFIFYNNPQPYVRAATFTAID